MSHAIRKIIVNNTRINIHPVKNITKNTIKTFSDEVNRLKDIKNKRPMFVPDSPKSEEEMADVCKQSETNKHLTSTYDQSKNHSSNYSSSVDPKYKVTANPEYVLEDTESDTANTQPKTSASIDNPPTTCCMSGCNNCVYILWADSLSKKMATADPEVAKKILDQVQDPGMKSFLKMELKNLGILK